MSYVKKCPSCEDLRPGDELFCQNELEPGVQCKWDLTQVTLQSEDSGDIDSRNIESGDINETNQSLDKKIKCRNGHEMSPDDFVCTTCGEDSFKPDEELTHAIDGNRIWDGWQLESEMKVVSGEADLFFVKKENSNDDEQFILKLYRRGIEPETDLYPALQKVDPDFAAKLYGYGRHDDRAYEVWEHIKFGSLSEIYIEKHNDLEFIKVSLKELGAALNGLEKINVRHRDLKPANILIRTLDPLDLVVADFGTAVIGEYELEATLTRRTTRYAAPEVLVGTFSETSDWWSVGVIMLEMLTGGKGFEGVHEKAFLLHLVTKGIPVPESIPEEWQELLKGLLTKNHKKRWQWSQVEKWLNGERGIPHSYDEESGARLNAPPITLNNNNYEDKKRFALAAAELENWDFAKSILQRGEVVTWLKEIQAGDEVIVQIRRIVSDGKLDWDLRLSLSLMAIHDDLPLTYRGELVEQSWLLNHTDITTGWLKSSLVNYLKIFKRTRWFIEIKERADRIESKIREFEVPVDTNKLKVNLLVSSAAKLEQQWFIKRKRFPDADNETLSVLYQRRNPSDEDLIVLLSAETTSLKPESDVIELSKNESRIAQINEFDVESAKKLFEFSQKQIFDLLLDRISNFSRCNRSTADEWVDNYRVDRRISLHRALALLAIPETDWIVPPKQQYVKNILAFYQKKLISSVNSGSLVRLTVTKSSVRIDINELGGERFPASHLLSYLLQRTEVFKQIDPGVIDAQMERRLRRLQLAQKTYYQNTGIRSLYLAFPVMVFRDPNSSSATRPRVAPVFLWPIKLKLGSGGQMKVEISFDSDRDVTVNHAITNFLGEDVLDKLNGELDEILSTSVTIKSINDRLKNYGDIANDSLSRLPRIDRGVVPGKIIFHCSAVLFLRDYGAQTSANDLSQIANIPIDETALGRIIRVNDTRSDDNIEVLPAEVDRYFTADIDPSQQVAVFKSRSKEGLVVQGPPGTGKSQTIVNIVSDAIGRNEKVLVVCQKKAALDVVRKRLEAEHLKSRFVFLERGTQDRKSFLQDLRAQLDNRKNLDREVIKKIKRDRLATSERIQSLEDEINKHHSIFHSVADANGLSYREIIQKLLELKSGSTEKFNSSIQVKQNLKDWNLGELEEFLDRLNPLASYWLNSNWENSPYDGLKQFNEPEEINDFRQDLERFSKVEYDRKTLLELKDSFFDTEAFDDLREWLNDSKTLFNELSLDIVGSFKKYGNLFTRDEIDQSDIIEKTNVLLDEVNQLNPDDHNEILYTDLNSKSHKEILLFKNKIASAVDNYDSYLPWHWFNRYKINKYLKDKGLEANVENAGKLAKSVELEYALKPLRLKIISITAQFESIIFSSEDTVYVIKKKLSKLFVELKDAKRETKVLNGCPVGNDILINLITSNDIEKYRDFYKSGQLTIDYFDITIKSLQYLSNRMNSWFESDALNQFIKLIKNGNEVYEKFETMVNQINNLSSYQNFRPHKDQFNGNEYSLLKSLRLRVTNHNYEDTQLANIICNTILHEGLTSWKDELENKNPVLRIKQEDLYDNIKKLKILDDKYRKLNRDYLSNNFEHDRIASRREWDDIVMYTGKRHKKLRAILTEGDSYGLFELRPVWLMGPETVSTVLPMKPGMFDLVVFDEASQMFVQSSLAALFRAKRAVICGDDKQMPPSNFFSARVESDEEDDDDDWVGDDNSEITDKDRANQRETANRRDVKDCEDLLSLAQITIPTETLKIHYRSKYRHLIDYSNAAFYQRSLSILANHSDSHIEQVKPIEVIRCDSEYKNQTNLGEANKIVEILDNVWRNNTTRPTIGVATFNAKQSELIYEQLSLKAQNDEDFRKARDEEDVRNDNGEDVSFFVKNVENIQGDERDWIIFSTTFGQDSYGTFRRNFGKLGHIGGERRLNVAVTRAKQKIIFVTSMPFDKISNYMNAHRAPNVPRDFIQAYLYYAEYVYNGQFSAAENLLRTMYVSNSEEKGGARDTTVYLTNEIKRFLESNGCTVKSVKTGDAFHLDLAIQNPVTGLYVLGIECDSPNHYLLKEARAREIWRRKVLKMQGIMIHRVWSNFWYKNRRAEQTRLLNEVNKYLTK
jgi:primosomal replication protein N''